MQTGLVSEKKVFFFFLFLSCDSSIDLCSIELSIEAML